MTAVARNEDRNHGEDSDAEKNKRRCAELAWSDPSQIVKDNRRRRLVRFKHCCLVGTDSLTWSPAYSRCTPVFPLWCSLSLSWQPASLKCYQWKHFKTHFINSAGYLLSIRHLQPSPNDWSQLVLNALIPLSQQGSQFATLFLQTNLKWGPEYNHKCSESLCKILITLQSKQLPRHL